MYFMYIKCERKNSNFVRRFQKDKNGKGNEKELKVFPLKGFFFLATFFSLISTVESQFYKLTLIFWW